MHWAVAGSLAGRLVALAATLGVLAAGLGFRSIVWAWVAGLAVTFVIHLVAVRRIVPLRPVVDRAYWRNLFVGSLVIGLAIAISQIYFRIDMLLLALIRSSSEVGYYGAAYKFIELAQILGAAATVSMFPPLSNLLAARDPRAKELFQKTFDVLVAGGVFFGIVMLAFPDEIIELTAGPEFDDAAPALQLLAPWALFGFVNGAFWSVLIAAGRDRLLLACASGVLAINVGLNLALLPEYGYKAAAVVAVATEALVFIPLALVIREIGLLPDLRYTPSIALAGLAFAAIAWFVPGPAFVIGTAGATVYGAILLAAPGAVRDVARSLLPDRTPLLRTKS
jgi:O-antigen/teichoic acid export membrane protein